MRILITGSNGFLGENLVRFFLSRKDEVWGTDLAEQAVNPRIEYLSCDLADPAAVQRLIERFKPQVVINTIALVDVEQCEQDPELAYKVNVKTAEQVASYAQKLGARLIHISTDHLFSGEQSFYTEESVPQPVNTYAATKWKAEKSCLETAPGAVIVRTNFYGWSHSGHKPTFAEWLYQSLKSQKPLTLFKDYYFCPIEVTYLAEALVELIGSDFSGIINVVGAQRCSKYEFALALAREFGLSFNNIKVASFKTQPNLVSRPADLSLSVEKFKATFKSKLPNMREGLLRFKANQ